MGRCSTVVQWKDRNEWDQLSRDGLLAGGATEPAFTEGCRALGVWERFVLLIVSAGRAIQC